MRYISKIQIDDGYTPKDCCKFLRMGSTWKRGDTIVTIKDFDTGAEETTKASNIKPSDVDYGIYTNEDTENSFTLLYKYTRDLVSFEQCLNFREFITLNPEDVWTIKSTIFMVQTGNRYLLHPFPSIMFNEDDLPATLSDFIVNYARPECFLHNMSEVRLRTGYLEFACYDLSEKGRALLSKLRLLNNVVC